MQLGPDVTESVSSCRSRGSKRRTTCLEIRSASQGTSCGSIPWGVMKGTWRVVMLGPPAIAGCGEFMRACTL